MIKIFILAKISILGLLFYYTIFRGKKQKMLHKKFSNKGYGMIGMLIVLVIIGILTYLYMDEGPDSTGKKVNMAQTNIEHSADVSCSVNRETAQNNVNMWLINHQGELATIEKLQKSGNSIPGCPGTYKNHGKYFINSKNEVICTAHGPFYPGATLPPTTPTPTSVSLKDGSYR